MKKQAQKALVEMTKTLIKRNPPTVNYPPMNELNLHGFSNVEYEGRQIMEAFIASGCNSLRKISLNDVRQWFISEAFLELFNQLLTQQEGI